MPYASIASRKAPATAPYGRGRALTLGIDTHAHPFSFPSLEARKHEFRRREDVISFRTRSPGEYRRRFLEDPIDICDDMVRVMDRHGIGAALIQSTRGNMSNDDVVEAAGKHPGRLFPLVRVGPNASPSGYEDDPGAALRQAPGTIERAVEEAGVKGVGETSIRAMTRARFSDDIAADMKPVMEVLERYRLPIQFPTAWTQFSGALYYGNPILLDDLAASHPDVPVILTKMGRGIQFYFDMAMTVARRNVNVYLDIVGTSAEHLRQALDTIGPNRIMFGTDWSATWRMLEPDVYQEGFDVLEGAKATPEERRSILFDTARRLFDIDLQDPSGG